MQIRDANMTDAAAIYTIWANGWKYAYKNILSSDFLVRRCGDVAVAEKVAKFPEKLRKEKEQGNIFLVLTDDSDRVIGFVSGGAPSSPECNADKELDMLYLDTNCIGTGAGKLLFQTFAREMKKQGARTFGLMCFSDNKSIGFYKKMGGVITITRPSSEKFERTNASFIEFDIDEVLKK